MPFLFQLMKDHGYTVLDACGPAVGLDNGVVGNSEIGHLTIGGGRQVLSTLSRIDRAFSTGEWAAHALWPVLAAHERLCSQTGVHGDWRSMVQAATLAARCGVKSVVAHPILDGVDSAQGMAPALLAELIEALQHLPGVTIGVVTGRRPFCDRSGNLALTRAFATALTGACDIPNSRALLSRHVTPKAEADFPAHCTLRVELLALESRFYLPAIGPIELFKRLAFWPRASRCSDHGNAYGRAIGSHSDRPVPFIVVAEPLGKFSWVEKTGSLANIAASLLTTTGVTPPPWMAPSLLKPLR